jgi:hypothetical protein
VEAHCFAGIGHHMRQIAVDHACNRRVHS